MNKKNLKEELELHKQIKNVFKNKTDTQTMVREYNRYHEFILKKGIPSEKRKGDGFLYAPPHYKNLAEKIIFKLITPQKRILEIGIGDGRLSYQLAKQKKCQVTGIDISDIAIKLAQKRFKNADRIKYIKADARKLPFKNKVFDIAVSKDLLEHLPAQDHRKHLKEVKRVLKNKGIYIIFTPPKLTNEKSKGLHLKEYSLKEITNLLKRNGFLIKIYWVQAMSFGVLFKMSKKLINIASAYEFFLEKTKMHKIFIGLLNKILIPRYIITAQNE